MSIWDFAGNIAPTLPYAYSAGRGQMSAGDAVGQMQQYAESKQRMGNNDLNTLLTLYKSTSDPAARKQIESAIVSHPSVRQLGVKMQPTQQGDAFGNLVMPTREQAIALRGGTPPDVETIPTSEGGTLQYGFRTAGKPQLFKGEKNWYELPAGGGQPIDTGIAINQPAPSLAIVTDSQTGQPVWTTKEDAIGKNVGYKPSGETKSGLVSQLKYLQGVMQDPSADQETVAWAAKAYADLQPKIAKSQAKNPPDSVAPEDPSLAPQGQPAQPQLQPPAKPQFGHKQYTNANFEQAKQALIASGNPNPTAADVQNYIQNQKIEVAQARPEAQARYGFVPALDTQSGNAPTLVSRYDLANEQQGRYLPSNSTTTGALNKTALVEDIKGTINNTRLSLKKMPEFDKVMLAKLALVSKNRDPKSALDTLMASAFASTLSEEQIDYLTDLQQLMENAMAMRNMLGAGQGSDELRATIAATIPSAKTPSKKYAMTQLDKFEQTINRLAQGIPDVPLTPAKGKTQSGQVSQPTQQQYKIGQEIPVNGKKYKVTGFDTDGEPMVEEMQ